MIFVLQSLVTYQGLVSGNRKPLESGIHIVLKTIMKCYLIPRYGMRRI